MSNKHAKFLEEIAYKYHPYYKYSSLQFRKEQITYAMLSPKSIGIENIVEESLAYTGGYNFIDSSTRDFDDIDNSDCKTGTVNLKTRRVEISGISKKIGALRLTIWNQFLNSVDYMFIPYHLWRYTYSKKCYGINTDGELRLQMTWNKEKNTYNMFEPFRLPTFEALAKQTEENFYNQNPTFKYKLNQLSISLQDLDLNLNSKTDPSGQTANPYSLDIDLS